MNDSTGIVALFRETLRDCKRLYIQAARASLEDNPDADEATRRDLIRRMVDLHKGLLIKIYVTIAAADARWSHTERELACELIDHLWQQRLRGDELRDVTRRMYHDAGKLNWYSLVRPFDQITAIRDMSADVQTVVMRIANLVAKADGTVSHEETNALQSIQRELEVHLQRISLDDGQGATSNQTDGAQATQIRYQDPTLAPSKSESATQSHTKTGTVTSQTNSCEAESGDDEDTEDSLEQALDDLHQLVGLDQVKKEVTTLTNYLTLQQHRIAAGLPQHTLSLHMVFKGNPGTGKTTVARIVGRIFKALGLLKKGQLVETDRSGLVAEYAGQTATKTNRKIDEALDGILFIDEAYSLASHDQSDAYGAEAIQALVKRMEDDRDRLVVILAGYPEPIQELLESNPGLSSRFNTQMTFEDYAPVDLGRIYHLMCTANHYELPGPARAKLLLGFQWLYEHRDEHFGNGRLVRNAFENSVRHLANRVASITPVTRELLTVLTGDDIVLKKVPPNAWTKLENDAVRFSVTCDSCKKTVLVRSKHLGTCARCPHCQGRITIEWAVPIGDQRTF